MIVDTDLLGTKPRRSTMLKKMMLMVTLATAVAAFVAPNAGAAFENSKWSMGGTELKEAGTIEGTATQVRYKALAGLGGIECHTVFHSHFSSSSGTGAFTKVQTTN